MPPIDIVRNGYEDWIELLKHTGREDLLTDTYNVWQEAFHVATLLERNGTLYALQTQLQLVTPEEHDEKLKVSVEDAKQLQIAMLKQVFQIIQAKGS